MKKNKNIKNFLFGSKSSVFVLLIAMILISVVCFSYSSQTKQSIKTQNIELLENSAKESEKYLTVIFDYAKQTMQVISEMYEKRLTSPNIDFHELKEIRENTPFDFIRFVNKNGIAVDSEGRELDANDRHYFKDGIKGNTNVDAVKGSRYTSEFVFAAYTPLCYKGEIIGVLTGILSESTLTSILQAPGFSREISTFLCTTNGDTVATSSGIRDPENIIEFCSNPDAVSRETLDKIREAFSKGNDCLFTYKKDGETNTAYIKTSSSKSWIMVQTFPKKITDKTIHEQNLKAFKMELSCVILFLACIVYLMFIEIKKRLKSEETSEKKLLKSSQNLTDTISILSDRYYKVLKCNLETAQCEIIKINIKDKFSRYANNIVTWANKLVENNVIFSEDIKTFKEFFNLENARKQLVSGKKSISLSYRRIVDGDVRWVKIEILKSAEFTSETPVIVLYLLDIDEDVKKEKALKESYESAVKANMAKTQFLSAMSHDIRTPMHAIIGMTSIAGVHLDDRERVKECLEKITVSSKHLLGLINDVLDMSKIESGKVDLNMEEFNISQLIDNLLTLTREQLNTKHHNLEVLVSNLQHEHVVGDSQRIQQVFVNMMSNAIKYTPEGGNITISAMEKNTKKENVGCYEFIFQDNGIGMSEEYLKKIFQPFSRAEDDERVRKIQGTGLGMAISRNIVQMMNGDIKVESELNKGTKITVTIYLQLQSKNGGDEFEDFKGLPVLIVDDEQLACTTACETLASLGMKPEFVLSGKEAVELISKRHSEGNHFFAVIVDWKMPDMDGLETTKKIRESVGEELPIIIISAYDWSTIESEARSAGANNFISKPLFKSRLSAMFHRLTTPEAKEEFMSKIEDLKKNDFSGKRVLLVEDIEMIAEMTTEILQMANLEVETAANGQIALDKIKAVPDGYYDLVFMDIQMPVMNGHEAAKAIRALDREYTKNLPIIAMSANTFSDDIIASKNAGMNEHIGKPFEFDDLLRVLNHWIKGKD